MWHRVLIIILLSLYDVNGQENCPCEPLPKCKAILPADGVYTQAFRAQIRKLQCGPRRGVIRVRCCGGPPTVPCLGGRGSTLPCDCGMQKVTIDRVHGGTEIGLGEHPWLAAFNYNLTLDVVSTNELLCGGSLITNRHVLTAAHCVTDLRVEQELDHIKLGEWDKKSDPDCGIVGGKNVCAPRATVRRVAKISIHPDYDLTNGIPTYDVAIVHLDRPVEFGSFIQPICLPDASQTEPGDATVIGWGKTELGHPSDKALKVKLPRVQFNTCNNTYDGVLKLRSTQICYGGERGKDSCQGDSGGPLVWTGRFGPPFKLVGVVSFGLPSCGQRKNYGVYTSVSRIRSWIDSALSE